MKTFGDLLRYYRRKCDDSVRGGKLTQERLGELIGNELGDTGYTGAAISGWERNKNKISQNDYGVLTKLIKVLGDCGGIKTPTEANAFLAAGNYRSLNEDEEFAIFGKVQKTELEPNAGAIRKESVVSPLSDLLYWIEVKWFRLVEAFKSPSPHPFTAVWDGLGQLKGRVGVEIVLRGLIWISVWLLTSTLVFPLMRWPFKNEAQIVSATYEYLVGGLAVPLLVGGLTRTRDNPFWKGQGEATSRTLRLYTHQGAFIGFHLVFTLVFFIRLILHYLGIDSLHFWVEGLAAAFILMGSYSAAHQVPFNLFRAYGRLHLHDGAIFFLFIFYGPLFGGFFFAYNNVLLTFVFGIQLIISAAIFLSVLFVWQRRRSGSTVIPAHIWVAIFGSMAVLYQASNSLELFPLVVVSSMVAVLVASLAWEIEHLTLLKVFLGFIVSIACIIGLRINTWLGVAAGSAAIALGLRFRKYVWVPWGFWEIVGLSFLGGILFVRELVTEEQASLGILLVSAIVIWREKRKTRREKR